jgi:plastocyanin
MRLLAGSAVAAACAATAIPAVAATKTVKIGDDYFVRPGGARVTVTRGKTVTWVWRGHNAHNVTATGPVRFSSPVKKTGTFSKRLTKRGTYRIFCAVHGAKQKMTLVVR